MVEFTVETRMQQEVAREANCRPTCKKDADNAETCRQRNRSKYCSGSSCGSDPVLTSLTLKTHLLGSQLFPLLLPLSGLVPPLATSSPLILGC